MKIQFGIKQVITLLMSVLTSTGLNSQTLDDYILKAFNSNLVLQQKDLDVQKATVALQEAKAYFLPRVDFTGTFITGDGGRFINIPVGDLLNPVYTALNFLTQSQLFPQIENVTQNFFPSNQHDIKIRTSVALYNSDIVNNRNLQSLQIALRNAELDLYKRELAKQVSQAYYQYLMALENIRIYESALLLVERNVKVNASLYNAGKAVPAQVLRSESELEQVNGLILQANKQLETARAYFNFLLNRPFDTEINADFNANEALENISALQEKGDREESRMLAIGKSLQETRLKMLRQFHLPKAGAFVDLGSQAEDLRFNTPSLYYFVGVQVDVPVFNRPQKFKLQQTRLDIAQLDVQRDYTERQTNLGLTSAQNQLAAALGNIAPAKRRLESASAYFRLVEKGYNDGIFSLIEFIDARNQLTQAEIQLNLQTYQALIQSADVERQAATYNINR
jgi:outer membrane protein TolC